MTKKKIWLINHYATSMYENRGGRHFWFAKYLKIKGYDPIVICANTFHDSRDFVDVGQSKYLVKSVCINNRDATDTAPFVFVKTISAQGNGFRRLLNMLLFYKNLFPVSKKLVREYGKPDIILASSVHPLTLVAGIKIAQKMNIPCICEIRDLWPEAIFAYFDPHRDTPMLSQRLLWWLKKMLFGSHSLLGKIMLKGEYWIYNKASKLIFTHEGGIDYIKEKKWDIDSGGEVDINKVFHINNGVDLEEFDELVEKGQSFDICSDSDLNSELFRVVYIGAIRSLNNIDILVETALYLKDFPDIKILIYGDGNKREGLETKVKDLGLKNIYFKGKLNKQAIPYILSKSSLNMVIYPQSQWNWTRGISSNKLFEYMASGKPILSSCKMGYSIVDNYKCGIEIANASPEQLAKEILRFRNMAKDEYEEYCQNARNGAKDFDFKVLTEKLISIL